MKTHRSGQCAYCGAKSGEACVVTLAPEVGPLAIEWHHASREEAKVAA